jgi:hypothetical protein
MTDEKIKIKVTETGQSLDVVVFSKRADCIEVVLGEGVHNMKCTLTPTRNGMAYVGNEGARAGLRAAAAVQADIDRLTSTCADRAGARNQAVSRSSIAAGFAVADRLRSR